MYQNEISSTLHATEPSAREIEIIHYLTFNLLCYVFKGEAFQNKGRTSEKLNSGGFEDNDDKKDKEEGKGDLQATAEEPEEFLGNANKNTSRI